MVCPNISHPDWKKLVDKIGENYAYLEFIKNNEDIPNPDDPRFDNYHEKLALNKSENLLPGFVSYDQQVQAINTASDVVLAYMKTHPKNIYYQHKITKKFIDKTSYTNLKEDEKLNYERKVKSTGFDRSYKNFENELNDLIESTNDPVLQVIKDNLQPIREEVKIKLQNLGLIQKEQRSQGIKFSDEAGDEELEGDNGFEIEGLEGVEDVFVDYWKDNWSFSYDSKNKVLTQLKQFLSFIPKTKYDKNLKENITLTNYLGSPDYMSYDLVYEDLSGILANTRNTWEDMRAVLESKIEDKPYIATLLEQIDNYDFTIYTNIETDEVISNVAYSKLSDTEQQQYYKVSGDKKRLIHQFVSTMSKSYSGSSTVLSREINGLYDFRVIDTDQQAIRKALQNNWIVNFEQSPVLRIVDGEQVANEDVISKLVAFIDKEAESPTSAGMRRILNAIGVEISDRTQEIISTQGLSGISPKALFKAKRGLFRLIKERLEGYDANDLDGYNKVNPLVNNSAIAELAKLEAVYTSYTYTNSYRNGKGEIVYAYTLNKALIAKLDRIKNDPEFRKKLLNTHFNRPLEIDDEPIYKTWLWQLEHNPSFTELVDITPKPFDTIREADTFKDGLNLDELSDRDFEALQLALIQNNGTTTEGTRLIKYLLTVPAKTTSYIINGTGVKVELLFNQNSYKIDGKTTNALYSIFLSEYNRNLYLQNNKVDYTIGNQFYFFPEFNKTNEIGKKLYNSDGTLKLLTSEIDGKPFQNYVKENINAIVKRDIQDKIDNWKEIGIIQNNEIKVTDNKYAKSFLEDKKGEQRNIYVAADFVINSILAKYNLHQLVINDPALYAKKSVKETWDNVDKRLASLIAPGKDLSLESYNEDFISIKLKDQDVAALNYAELEKRLGDYAEAYKNIEATDAQEYTTLKEHLFVLYRLGEIPTIQYQELLKKIDKEGDNLILTKADLDKVLQPQKPVYSDTIIKSDGNIYEEYIKSSSIPLIPQFTKGLELDKLRKAAEKLEKQTGKSVRIAHKSATKLGGTKFADIYNSDNTIKDDLDLTDSYTVLSRSGFRIQQDIPDGSNKQFVVKSTQATKLLFDSVWDINNFNYHGETRTAQSLFDEYNKLHQAIYAKGAEQVDKKLKNSEGNIDVNKLQKILLEEAQNRDFSESDIQALELNKAGEFKTPLWASPSASKLEALITSIYSNNIVKQKMHGKSYILVSEAGIKGRSEGIVYTEKYQGELKPLRLENGKIMPAQVLMPWSFKDGKTRISINKYIREDGLLDLNKVPEEVLQQFGFRIPNQGHNSMSLIEIVGFTPESMGDVVIAPRNFVKQMGSDFDIDKLYVYDYFVKLDDNKNIVRKNVEKNDILDIHKAILSHPSLFDKIVKPLDTGLLKNQNGEGIAVELKKVYEQNYKNYLNPNYSRNKYLQSVDAKTMVGITSLTSTFSSLIQGKDIHLQKRINTPNGVKYIDDYIIIGNSQGEEIYLSDLSNPYVVDIETGERTKRTKTEVISAKQSAAVDNEKDPIIFFINLNSITAPVSNLFDHLGVDEVYSSLFISQPVIREYVQRVKSSKGIIAGKSTDKKAIMVDLIKEYKSKLGSFQIKQQEAEDYPLTIEELRQPIFKKEAKTKGVTLTDDQIQYLVLQKFRKMEIYGDEIDRTKNIINIDAKGIGKSLLHVADRTNKVANLAKQTNIANLMSVIGNLEGNQFIPTTFQGHAIAYGLIKADQDLNQDTLLPYNSVAVRGVISLFKELTSNDIISVETSQDLYNNFKSYIYSGYYRPADRERIFFDKKDNKSLAKKLLALKQDSKFANNQFLIRLLVEPSSIDPTGKMPSRIYYNSAKEQNIEEYQIYKDFNALVNHEDDYIRSIGKDLVDYFFINGGNRGSRDWSNYIDLNYLDATGFNSYINNISFNDTINLNPKTFLKQYFQHKPYLAPALEVTKEVKINKERTVLELPQVGSANTITSILSDNEEYGYYPIIHIKTNAGYELYIQQKDGHTYRRVDTLGTKFYTEYDFGNKAAVSLIKKQHFQTDIPNTWIPKNLPTNQEGNIPYLINSLQNVIGSNLNTTLNKLEEEKAIDSKLQLVADFLKTANPYIGNTKFEVVNSSTHQYSGMYSKKTKQININLYRQNSKQELAKTILHEGIHRLYDFVVDRGLTGEQKKAYDNLTNIFNTFRKQIQEGEHSEFDPLVLNQYEDTVQRLMKGEKLTNQEQKFLDTNYLYYHLTDFEEFIVGFFTNQEFQKVLNNKKAVTEKSLLTKLIDSILSIIEPFLKALNIKTGSLLEDSVANALTLLNTENEAGNIAINNDLEIKYNLGSISNQSKMEKSYSRLLNDFNFRVKSLQNSLAKEKNIKVQTELRNSIEKIAEQIDELIDKTTLDNVVDIANNDLNYIQSLVDRKVLSKQQINYSKTLLATWTKITDPGYELITEQEIGSERYTTLAKVRERANTLFEIIDTIAKQELLQAVQADTKQTITKDNITHHREIGVFTSAMLDLSRSGNALFGVADKWIREAIVTANTEANSINTKVEELTNNLKKNPLFSKSGFDLFAETTQKTNELTGNIVSEFTPEYRIELNRLKKATNTKSKSRKALAFEEFYKWVKDNHNIIDIRSICTEDKDGKLIFQGKDAQAKLIKEFGVDYVRKQIVLINHYNDALELAINAYGTDADGERAVSAWRTKHNPLIYLNNLEKGENPNSNEGDKYIIHNPKEQWHNSRFKTIQANKELKEFYDYYTQTLNQLYNYIPEYLRYKSTEHSIPGISKNLREEFKEKGFSAVTSGIHDSIIEALTITSNQEKTLIDPTTGKESYTLGLRYLNQLDPKDKSYDLSKVLKIFALETLTYKHKAEVEDKIRLADAIVQTSLEKSTNPDGSPKIGKFGEVTDKKGLTNLKNQWDYAISAFYGRRKNEKEWATTTDKILGKKLLTESEKKQLEDEIEKINLRDIPQAKKDELIAQLRSNPRRYFSYGKLTDTVLKYVQLKGMGFNLFSAGTNLIFGWFSNFNWAAGREDFTTGELMKANSIMLSSVLGDFDTPVANKIRNLMEKYDTLKEISEASYESNTSNNRFAKDLTKIPYELQRRSEYFVQGMTMVAMMLHQKVVVNGKEMTLWDAHDNFGNIKDQAWDGGGKEFLNFKLKMDQILKSIHGNYDPNSPVLIKKSVLGRAVLQFRSWVAEGFANRFEDEKYDELLGRVRKGRYRTLADLGFVGSAKAMLRVAISSKIDLTDLTNLEGPALDAMTANIRKNLNELYQKGTLLALALLLQGLDDDDDYDDFYLKYALNTIFRLQDDIEFFYNPNSFENISRSFVPAFTLIRDTTRFYDAVGNYIVTGEDEIPTGPYAGESRVRRAAFKVFPFTSAYSAVESKFTSAEEFRK